MFHQQKVHTIKELVKLKVSNMEKKLDNAFDLINKGISKGVFPGATVAVGTKHGVLRLGAYGNKCYNEENELKIDALFDLASLTKVVATSMLFMKFLEKGRISVYDNVVEYLPNFKDCGKEKVTILELITHTSGLVAFVPLYKRCKDYEDAINYICNEVVLAKTFDVIYSDLNYILLGRILEFIGGKSLDVLCKEEVFGLLNMNKTGFNPRYGDFVPTELQADGKALYGICHDENARFFGGISGHAGLFSNINDMVKLADMLINEGKGFISKASYYRMTTNYTEKLGGNRGWGWCIKGNAISSGGDIISPKAFGHTGFTGTSIWIDPVSEIYIILLTNRVYPTRENNEIIRFRRLFHNAVIAAIAQ